MARWDGMRAVGHGVLGKSRDRQARVIPGSSYSYSNPGYNTLGALIEISSGQPLETFLRNEIYRPLGMVDTSNHEIAGKLEGKTLAHGRRVLRAEGWLWG